MSAEDGWVWVYLVYTIRDENGGVRYVGMTSQDDEVRFGQHFHSKKPIGEWMRAEVSAGRKVSMVVEEQFCSDDHSANDLACKAERQYIHGYSALLGDLLLNVKKKKTSKFSSLMNIYDAADYSIEARTV